MLTLKANFGHRAFFSIFILLVSLLQTQVEGQENFDKAEFASRRAKVFEKIGDGVAVVFANEKHRYPLRFRQSPDFYYLTGITEPDAILVMVGKTKRTLIFANRSEPWNAAVEGPGIFDRKDSVGFYGISAIFGLDQFFHSYAFSTSNKVYAPLTGPDDVQNSRGERLSEEGRRLNYPLSANIARYKQAISKLKEWQPQLTFHDINLILDELRWVKSPYEIERMRMTGKIGAEGVKEAIKGTKAGMFEYELEAAAKYIYVKNGAGDAFTPIVASGPNTMILHYTKNDRRMKDGDVVLMDYGSDYDYYTSDITRTWPVSGKFTPEQEKMYRCILEARDAIIAMMKPGIKVSDMQNTAEKVYKKHGFEKQFNDFGRYVGHFIGMSVHDVGEDEKPFVAGVVYNVEPLIQDEKLQTHLRLEDTILITQNGAENLTAGVPAGITEIYALQREKPVGRPNN
jgi:Xaa-Pro aminopeptidase